MKKKRWLLLILLVTGLGMTFVYWWTMAGVRVTRERVLQIRPFSTEAEIAHLFGGPAQGAPPFPVNVKSHAFVPWDIPQGPWEPENQRAWVTPQAHAVVYFDTFGKATSVAWAVYDETPLEKVRRFLHLD